MKPHTKGYLACMDFRDAAGSVHDVDVVVGKSGGELTVQEVFLRKVDGKPVTEKPLSGK